MNDISIDAERTVRNGAKYPVLRSTAHTRYTYVPGSGAMDGYGRHSANKGAYAHTRSSARKTSFTMAVAIAAATAILAGAFVLADSDGSDAAIGSTFTAANAQGIDIEYKVLAESGSTGTVRVGSGNNRDTAIADTASGTLNIPETVTNGGVTYTVETIGNWAFYDYDVLTSVTIPDTVKTIGNYAFFGCNSLTSVIIPDPVISIGSQAFNYCDALTSITAGTSNLKYSSDAQGALYDKDKTTLIECPGGYSGSFAVPDTVTSIDDCAFSVCSALTSITVGDSNASYSSDAQGTLYNKDKTELMRCPGGYSGSFTVLDTVTSISISAFYECNALTSVTIPDSVTSIGYDAFHGCGALTSTTIGNGVTYISDKAFDHGFRDSSGKIITQVSEIAGHSYVLDGDCFTETVPDDDGFPILYVAIGAIAGIAIVGGAVFYLHRRKNLA